MRVRSQALTAAWLTCAAAACSFSSSGAGGAGAAPASATPVNGHPSTPSQVDCNGASATGATLCATASDEECCAVGAAAGTCQSDEAATCAGTGGWIFECDEAADCAAGEVCCRSGSTFACAATCAQPAAQSCRLTAECTSEGPAANGATSTTGCLVQTCNGGIFAELCGLGSDCTAVTTGS